MAVHGKRGCSLTIAFCLHTLGLIALLLGCLTPYWSKVTVGGTETNVGLLLSTDNGEWVLKDFNLFKTMEDSKEKLYSILSVSLALVTIFMHFFLVQAYAFALYNRSCGLRYNPDMLLAFSLFSGFMIIATLVFFEMSMGRMLSQMDSALAQLDYSRACVICFIACAFFAAFFTVCDRTEDKK